MFTPVLSINAGAVTVIEVEYENQINLVKKIWDIAAPGWQGFRDCFSKSPNRRLAPGEMKVRGIPMHLFRITYILKNVEVSFQTWASCIVEAQQICDRWFVMASGKVAQPVACHVVR
jgi:hypothetical protein